MGTAPTAEAASEEESEPEAAEDEDEDVASVCMRRRPEWHTSRRTKQTNGKQLVMQSLGTGGSSGAYLD